MRHQNYRILLYSLILTLGPASASAQETFVQPPARLLTRFAFTLFSGGVMALKAKLDDFPDR
ncbi:MAG TPA: hypothetical protein VKR41_11855, partial [Puia sp.]|nr:hypothetical protein [Puia sp.]